MRSSNVSRGVLQRPGVYALAASIIAQAAEDCKNGDKAAAYWLAGDICAEYCRAIGFDHRVILAWLDQEGIIKRVKNMSDISNKIAEFTNQRGQIARDIGLSPEGKRQKLLAVDNLINAYKPEALSKLKTNLDFQIGQARAAHKDWQNAVEANAKSWDFGRLNYWRGIAESEYTAARDIPEAEAYYNRAVSSGDKYHHRAAAELGNSYLRARYKDGQGKDLARRMAKDIEKMTANDLADKAAAERSKWVNAIIQSAEEIKSAQAFYGNEQAFQNILKGIKITQRLNPGDPNRYVEHVVEFED